MTRFHTLLRDGAERFGARPAIRFDDAVLGYEDVLGRAEAFAAGLQTLGVDERDVVVTLMDNSVECIVAWLGVAITGATDVPINPQYRGELLFYLLSNAGATTAICDAAYLPQLAELMPRLPGLTRVIGDGDIIVDLPSAVEAASFATCASGGGRFAEVVGTGERVVLYTSGTTGPSKGVTHTQASCLTLARYNAEVLGYRTDDRLLNFFPLFHQNARYTGVVPAMVAGATIRVQRKLHTSSFWATCAADGATAFNYLGSVLRLILNVTPPDFDASRHTLRKAFGAGASPAAWEAFEQRLGIRLFEVYGLSEAPMATLNVARGGHRPPIGSAGRASDLFEVAVLAGDGSVAPPDEVGEIALRPRRPDAMMSGYHNNDAATVAACRDLWFHSGDRGHLSPEGDLYFGEREKDMIRRRGENISAWEVESVVDRHPDIIESAVFAVPSDDGDEEVAAALVLRRADADIDAIVAFARQHLPLYAVPTMLRVLADLPRTPTAKVQKAELRRADRSAYVMARPAAIPPR